MAPERVTDKAMRLLCEGKIAPLPAAHVFLVDGTHGTYTVLIASHLETCTCPATGRCSHIVAAGAWTRAEGECKDLMVEALAIRRAREVARMDQAMADLAARR